MAEMIPDVIPSNAGSAKIEIFETLKYSRLARDREWRIFHSIQVPQRNMPSRSRDRDIDFVILIPNQLCVICIVVVTPPRFRWRIWSSDQFIRHLESAKNITEDMRSLYFREESPFSLEYAVVSPDLDSGQLTIKVPNPDNPTEYESLDFSENTLKDYTENLNSELWEGVDEFTKEDDWNEWEKFWDKAQKEFSKLQDDLESKGTPTTTIFRDDPEPSRKHLLRLTEDQRISYEKLLKEGRYVIDGAAGTGKTVLAKDLAERRCQKGDTVGLLCSNRYLSHDFEKWAAKITDENSGQIIVGTPATLPGKIFEGDNTLSEEHKQRLSELKELEKTLKFGFVNDGWQTFVEKTIEALQQIIENTDTDPAEGGIFDYLIVDEAQNLCDEDKVFLRLMHVLLKQGLANGNWAMFGDFIYQDLVTIDRERDGRIVLKDFINHERGGREEEENLEEENFDRYELKINCRNTQEISDAVDKLVSIPSLPRSGVHGPHVEIKVFDSLHELHLMLKKLISTYHKESFKSTDCILLSSGETKVFDKIVQEYGGEYGGWKLIPLGDEDIEGSPSEGDILRGCDVHDYQGLESNLVILVMPETGENVNLAGEDIILTRRQHFERVLYTGMSRAHTMLVILAERNSYEEDLKDHWPDNNW